MAAELRRVGERTWVVDLACGFEEPWDGDALGAGLRAEEHNHDVHNRADGIGEWSTAAAVELQPEPVAAG